MSPIGCTALEGFEGLGQPSDTKLPVLYENLAIIELRNTFTIKDVKIRIRKSECIHILNTHIVVVQK